MSNQLTVREMTPEDPPTVAEAFQAQGWDKPQGLYEKYYQEQMEGQRTVLIAERNGKFVGYLTIVWESHYPPFRNKGIPEIVDFAVLEAHQRQGIGTFLMDAAELRVAEKSNLIGIGVGLHADYGAAQVMYAKRGYVPDGRGIHYNGQQLRFGDQTTVDDSLVICFTKELRR